MADLQAIFSRIKQTGKKRRELQAVYRDALANSKSYQDVVEELKSLQERKRRIEQAIRSDLASEMDQMERLKVDLTSDHVLLSDLALNQLVKGEHVEVTDEHDVRYEPVFQVKFKKTDEVKK